MQTAQEPGSEFLAEMKYLTWCLTIYSDFCTSRETRETLPWLYCETAQGHRENTHTEDILFLHPCYSGQSLLLITLPCTLHVARKQKATGFISLAFRGWCVSIQNQMEVEGDPTWRINNNTAVNLPLHQGQLSFPHCVSKTKKGSAGPSVLAHPCSSSMPPLAEAFWSCPRTGGWSLQHQQENGLLAGGRQVRRWGYTCWLPLGARRGQTLWDFLDSL